MTLGTTLIASFSNGFRKTEKSCLKCFNIDLFMGREGGGVVV